MHRKILLIEDDRDIAQLAQMHLQDQGYEVELEGDGTAGGIRVLAETFDLVILDLMLPGLDGLEICKRLRTRPDYTPLMILTARSTELDRILGLELGADDYLVKPVSFRELIARVKALLRRVDALQAQPAASGSGPLEWGPLRIEIHKRRVLLQDQLVSLTAKEFDLLQHFACHPGRVFTRAQLLDAVWGYGYDGYEHTVNSHINRLRAKIETDPADPRWILTVWGIGYKFAEETR